MGKDYEKLDVYTFGRQLIETNDLDPIYVMLWAAKLPTNQLHNWILAYLYFYHAGTSSWISNVITQDEYWKRMAKAAASKDYLRSSERRHFRGQASINAVATLQAMKATPQSIIQSFISNGHDLQSVMKKVKELPLCGNW